jgi:AcrR family transcriptional regulator
MSELVREHGAGGVTVAHIVARSGVSRRTFYELFEDREDCFLAAFDCGVSQAGETVISAYESGGCWRDRIATAMQAALVFIDAEPNVAYLLVVGALAAGPLALERRTRVTRALAAAVHEGRREVPAANRRPGRLVAEGLVGAVLAVIHARLVEQSPAPLLGLRNPLMAMIVLPYLGAAAAEGELRRSLPRARRPSGQQRRNPLRELDMRLTYRTVCVLRAIAAQPASSNRQVATAAGVSDQGQISKLLARLQTLGLIANSGGDHARGEPNAWALTSEGHEVANALEARAA